LLRSSPRFCSLAGDPVFVIDTIRDVECTTNRHLQLMIMSIIAASLLLFMSFRFLLVGNDCRHINVDRMTSPWRFWDWTGDRFRSVLNHPLYPKTTDHMVYTTIMKLFLSFIAVWLAPVIAFAPVPAFAYVITYIVQLYITMAYLPFNNTEFGLDILHENLVDPNEKERLEIMDAMARMDAYKGRLERKRKVTDSPPFALLSLWLLSSLLLERCLMEFELCVSFSAPA
jgi:hypothetical protein